MAHNFIPYEQKQTYLLPPSINDWIAELTEFYCKHRADGWGRAAYHPLMMVKVLIYGYCIGITSSRKLASSLERDIAFRYLPANHLRFPQGEPEAVTGERFAAWAHCQGSRVQGFNGAEAFDETRETGL